MHVNPEWSTYMHAANQQPGQEDPDDFIFGGLTLGGGRGLRYISSTTPDSSKSIDDSCLSASLHNDTYSQRKEK